MTPAQKAILFGRAPAFNPVSLFAGGVEGVLFDASDLSTMFTTSAGSTPSSTNGPVGRIVDKSPNGHNATQGTSSARPFLQTDGTYYWLEGDGIDDFLRKTFTIVQPIIRISAIRQISWTNGNFIFGAGTAVNGALLQQVSSSPRIRIYSGGAVETSNAPSNGTDFVVTELHNGASSKIAVNNGSYTTGNAGTTVPGGVTLFASGSDTSPANVRLYATIMIAGILSDANIALCRAWIGARAGLTL